jgi:hypothetical protein
MVTIDSKQGDLHIKYDPRYETLETKYGHDEWTFTIRANVSTLVPASVPVSSDGLSDSVDLQPSSTVELPSVERMVEFLSSKPNYRHDSAGVQEHFLGRIIRSRGPDQQLYHSLATVVRNARDSISEKHEGEWLSPGKRRIEGLKPVKIFEFIKKTNL